MISTEIDAFLEQLRALEGMLDSGRSTDAREAVEGMRRALLGAAARRETASLSIHDPKFEAAEALVTEAATSDLCRRFERTTHALDAGRALFGWHEEQIDARGRPYRWCGGAPEAGLLIESDLARLRWVALRIRPLRRDTFSDRSVEVRIDDRATPLRLLKQDESDLLVLAVEPSSLVERAVVSLFPLQRERPRDIGLGGDTRRLAFNVTEIIEIRVTETERRGGGS